MQRGPITAILAVVFYAALLFWASAWKSSDAPEIAGSDPAPAQASVDRTNDLPPSEPTTLPATSAPAAPEEIAQTLTDADFAAERSPDGSWEIDGQLAEQGTADAVRAAFKKSGAKVIGDLSVSETVAAAPWGSALATWIPQHQSALNGSCGLGVFDGQLLIAGSVTSDTERDALLKAARSHFADSGLEIVGEIEVVAPREPAEFAIIADGNGGYQIAGQLGEPELKSRVLELIAQLTEGAAVEDNLAVADHVAEAAWGQALVQVLPGLLVDVDTPQIMATAGAFLMSGAVSSDNKREALAEMVEQSFAGAPVSIDNQLEVAASVEPASLAISRGEDGVITIQGQLPEDLSLETLRANLRAAADDQPPAELIGSDGNIGPAQWLPQLEKLAAPFATSARWGALSVHGDQVALEAEVFDAETADVLTALVKNAFPEPAFKRVIEVSVAAPSGPSDEDISALDHIVRDSVIYFESNSDKLTAEGSEIASQIAAAMQKVPGSGIALLGHADPYGRAEYNRELSQRRCAAVRAVLEEAGIESLLIETEVIGESDAPTGKTYKSGRRVEFELR